MVTRGIKPDNRKYCKLCKQLTVACWQYA